MPEELNVPLALYVWEGDGVLEDYYSGLVCVLARSEQEAWSLLKVKDETAAWSLSGEGSSERIEPKRVTEPEAFACWGGG